jgi:voltage-gated potassium channel
VSRFFDTFLIVLIVVNVVAIILESVAALQARWGAAFEWLETVSVMIFTVEYLLRVWSIVDNRWQPQYQAPLRGRLRFMRSPMALIDLLAILPYWLSMFFAMDLRFLRVLRLLRVLKLTRYSAATNLLFEVLRKEARVIAAAMFTLFLVLVLMASATYVVEHPVQPEAFASIPQAMWWAIVTVTTVGYGDVVPVTPVGKLFGALLGVVGVGMVALPAGILASGFGDVLNQRRSSLRREYRRAMADGVVDDDERKLLRSRAAAYNLSIDEVDDLLEQDSDDRGAPRAVCPHCGKPLPPKSGRQNPVT